ncbi:MAG: M20/M25/M40 family metallo-hydrolase [Planctomycetota bacterium]|nr:M20/M25/M40 family metallo-hydrolase [Planctomycetota bacterium]
MTTLPPIPDDCLPALAWIDTQRERMLGLVTRWADINSHSDNVPGLALMLTEAHAAFAPLGDEAMRVPLPDVERIDARGQAVAHHSASALRVLRRPEVRPRVLLAIHFDTVYPIDNPFQKARLVEPTSAGESLRLIGPGVADAKGGLAVMLIALEAFERSPLAPRLGWEVILNPDEEVGSPGSAPLFHAAAARNDLAMLFEPALDDAGSLASARCGSGNFTLVVRGKAAHAGRDFSQGRSAALALSRIVLALDELNRQIPGITLNVGRIESGGPVNVVPDLALAWFNVRIDSPEQLAKVTARLAHIVAAFDDPHAFAAATSAVSTSAEPRPDSPGTGVRVELRGGFHAPPKPLDAPTQAMLDRFAACAHALGQPLDYRPTGGACDGNRLAAAGLVTVDSLGVCGGRIHSPEEYLLVDSLTRRASLVAIFLMTLARGDWRPNVLLAGRASDGG